MSSVRNYILVTAAYWALTPTDGALRMLVLLHFHKLGSTPVELTGRMLTELNFLVTLGCAERCPGVPLARREDWRICDPKGLGLDEVRAIRDEIHRHVSQLILLKGWARDSRPRAEFQSSDLS